MPAITVFPHYQRSRAWPAPSPRDEFLKRLRTNKKRMAARSHPASRHPHFPISHEPSAHQLISYLISSY
jgi:hypothetical protein